MQLTRSVPIAAGLALSLLWAGAPALAQQQPERETAVRADDRPAPLKVIVRAECTIYTEPSDSAGVRRQASPMEFFYVMPNPDGSDNYRIDETDDGWWYRVHTREQTVQGFQYGFIHSSNVTEWWHREAVGFLPRSNHRQRVRFYTSSDEWQQGFSTYPDPPDADEVALAIEPERLGNAGFVMPVLEAQENMTLELDGSLHNLYRVAFISVPPGQGSDGGEEASATPDETPSEVPHEGVTTLEDLANFEVDVVFCLDASGSMQPYINVVKDCIREISASLRRDHPDLQERFRFGLVDFRGPGQTQIICSLEEGRNHEAFISRLNGVQDSGGGDDGEDVLAGMSLAISGMDWSDIAFKFVILVGDEVGYDQENRPDLNTTGLSIADLVAQAQPTQESLSLLDAMRQSRIIHTIAIQAQANSAAQAQLRNRQFAAFAEGRDFQGRAMQFQPGAVNDMRQALMEELNSQIEGAQTAAGALGGGSTGGAGGNPTDANLPDNDLANDPAWQGVPAPFREMIEILRPGENGDGGLSNMADGWVSNFDAFGAPTVSERFLVSRYRLKRLQSVIESVGLELESPDVNPAVLVAMLQQRLAAMSIDQDISPTTSLRDVFEIVGGLPIRTPLMEMTAEQIGSMTPADRRRVIEKLQQMALVLQQQIDEPELWFKLDESEEDRYALAFISINDFR